MTQLKVLGSVGPDDLKGIEIDQWNRASILKTLRNYLEDRLENKYGVDANLDMTSEGSFSIKIVPAIDYEFGAELNAFAEKCISEFKHERRDLSSRSRDKN